jgi:hypothetical protein
MVVIVAVVGRVGSDVDWWIWWGDEVEEREGGE